VGVNFVMRASFVALFLIGTVNLGFGQSPAQQPYSDESTPVGWTWAQIRQGKEANLDELCKTQWPDVRSAEGWSASCRQLPGVFLTEILTSERLRGQIPFSGVRIVGAHIVGSINLRDAKLNRPFSIARSRIEDAIILEGGSTDSSFSILGSFLSEKLDLSTFHSEHSLELRTTQFKKGSAMDHAKIDRVLDMSCSTFDSDLTARGIAVGATFIATGDGCQSVFHNVELPGAKIDGDVNMRDATFDGKLDARGLRVGGALLMSGGHHQDIDLIGAKVDGDVDMQGAFLDGDLMADALHVGGSLRMLHVLAAESRIVKLVAAKIDRSVYMMGSHFLGHLAADAMRVGGQLILYSADIPSVFNGVRFVGAAIGGDLAMDRAAFYGPCEVTRCENDDNARDFRGSLNLEAVQVKGSVFMRGSKFTKNVKMVFANIGGNLDLRSAKLAELDLSNAVISSELRLGHFQGPATSWSGEDTLILSNASTATLVDTVDAWPEHLRLDGFRFTALGGFQGQPAADEVRRGADWWNDWLKRDPIYSPASYKQLATIFANLGSSDDADDMRFLDKVRQRQNDWDHKNWGSWFGSLLLQITAGFGIGNYKFIVLWWVIGISLAGAAYLWRSVKAARKHGALWCFGASLSRLLPVIEINKEFTDFFNDPNRERLTWAQTLVFSMIGLFGWFLGGVLAAPLSGLTEKL